jgi:hypothetical protein
MAAPAVRRIPQEVMASAAWPVYSPFAREHYGRGKDDGRVEAEADAVLSVLEARGIQVPEDSLTDLFE